MKSQIQENICKLYLRLNGYLTNGLIVHSPGQERTNRTDVDLIAIRFPHHRQNDRGFDFDQSLEVDTGSIEIIIGEVKGQKENLKFNKSSTKKYSEEISEKLFNWIGLFDPSIISDVINDYIKMIQPKVNYDWNERIFKEYSVNGFNIRVRPLIFGVDRFAIRDNQIWHINGQNMIDFFWKCFREEINNRNCQLKYDYKLWGTDLEPIVRYFKESIDKPDNFEDLYKKVLAPTKTISKLGDSEKRNKKTIN